MTTSLFAALLLAITPNNPQQGASIAVADLETQTQSLILTPGQPAEIEFEAEPNDVVIASVDSQLFDPALKLITESGEVLIENDDRTLGDQSPQILKRLTHKGKYKFIVTGYKGAAGGRFSIHIRRFNAPVVPTPRESYDFIDERADWKTIELKKDTPTTVGIYGSRATVPSGFDQNGFPLDNRNDAHSFESGGRCTFTSPIDQEIYIQIPRRGYRSFTIDAIPIKFENIELNQVVKGSLYRSESTHYLFDANAGDLLRFQTGPGRSGFQVQLKPVSLKNEKPGVSHTYLPGKEKHSNQLTFFIKEPGQYEAIIAHSEFRDKNFELSVSHIAKEWINNQPQTLTVGDNSYYKLNLGLGQLIDLTMSSTVFDLDFALYTPDGSQLVEIDDTGDSTDAKFQFLVTVPGTYYARIGSHGRGGGGEFNLSKSVHLPEKFQNNGQLTINTERPKLINIEFEKGKLAYYRLESNSPELSVQLYQPNGNRHSISALREPSGSMILQVNPELTGNFLLVVRCNSGEAKFSLKKIDIGE